MVSIRIHGTKAGPFMLAVLVVNILLGIVPFGGPLDSNVKAQTTQGPAWFNVAFDYRIPLEVQPFDFEAVNHPAEVDLNITAIVDNGDFKLDESSLFVVEYTSPDANGVPVQKRQSSDSFGAYSIPFRLYKVRGYDIGKNAVFTLDWLLDGNTSTVRHYFLYFRGLPTNGKGLGLKAPDDPMTFGMIDSNCWIQRGMVFYGFDPGEQTGWPDVDEVEVVGLYKGTSVKVINKTSDKWTVMNDTKIDRGGLLRYRTPDGTYFMVEADKPVLASVSSAMNGGGSAKTFYPSSDRNLVGRDFIIAPYNMTTWNNHRYGAQVYGVEESRVSIWDMAGNHIRELDVRKDNHTQVLDLKAGTVYHFRSTGDIMIEQEAINGFSALPSVTGAPVGRKFFGSIQDFDGMAIVVTSYESATVNIRDIDHGDIVGTFSMDGMTLIDFEPHNDGQYEVVSTGNISVIMGSTEGGTGAEHLGDDITFIGGQGGRYIRGTGFQNPGPGNQDNQYPGPYYSNIMFTFFKGTEVTIEGKTMTLTNGHRYGFAGGELTSSRPVSLMALGRGYSDKDAQHRWNDWGTYLAGVLRSPQVAVGPMERIALGIDLYPAPSEGAINDTMVHAVEPGRSTTFRICVMDIGDFAENVALTRGAVPTGWNASLDRAVVSVTPGQSVEVSLTISVPSNALKDTRLNISVRGDTIQEKGRSRNDTVFAEVVVDPVYFPELDGETVKHVDPGGTATFNLTLTNMGNGHDDISVGIDGQVPAGWTAVVLPVKAGLDPLKNATLRLNVTAPKDALAGASLVVDVRARSHVWSNRTTVHRTRTIVNHIYAFNASAPNWIKVKPGDVGLVNLSVLNLGNGHDNFSIGTNGPKATWTFDAPSSVGSDANAKTTISLKVNVPGKDQLTGKWVEGPGNRTVRINITDDVGLHKELFITVQVLQLYSLVLTAERNSLTIRSDQKAVYKLEIMNLGNGNDTFTLSTGANGTFDRSKITLQPADNDNINLTVPPSKNKARLITFDVKARSSGNVNETVTLTLQVIYPTTSTYVGEYTCLWIALVAICIFIVVKLVQRKFSKRRRRRHARR
jgi:uncharacterized membrane protein